MGGPYTLLAAAAVPGRVGAGVLVARRQPGDRQARQPAPARRRDRRQAYYFGIATNDDQRQPDAKDKLREAFAAASLPAKIEVYADCQHGWCVSDGMVYNKAGAERAYGEMTALYRQVLV